MRNNSSTLLIFRWPDVHSRPALLVDVSQYVSWPATTGVQRVLLNLARHWSAQTVDASFGFLDDEGYVIGPFDLFASVLAGAFSMSARQVTSEEVREALRRPSQLVGLTDIERLFDGYLLPEPTLRGDHLSVAWTLLASDRLKTFLIYYDALPLTHPEHYSKQADRQCVLTRYHLFASKVENVAFISSSVRRLLEERLARRPVANAIVVEPGADGLPVVRRKRDTRPTYAVLGTVEPRKRHVVVVDAFERLWSRGFDCHLIVLGASGSVQPDLIDHLRRLVAGLRVEWFDRPSDADVAAAVSRSWAALFVSSAEGYGLPPLEALAAGCPVVVASDLPSLEKISDEGQIRLDEVDPLTVAGAIERLADPAVNDAYGEAAQKLELPTWDEFTNRVESWIASTLVRRSSSANTAEPLPGSRG
jgi:glycosyltransferase involved in cell wall biosynthesis